MNLHPDISARLAQLANDLDGLDPWYDLDYEREIDDLEREFAETRLLLTNA
jgi:hypothetical protein